MVSIHESTRRRICRAVFLTVAVPLTVGTVAWAALRHLPGQAAVAARQWADDWSLAVEVEEVVHARPGTTQWQGVVLTDPLSGDVVLRARLIEWTDRGDRDVILVAQPEMNLARRDLAWEWLVRRLRRDASGNSKTLRLVAQDATLVSGERGQTFSEVVAEWSVQETESRGELRFRVAGDDTQQPGRIVLHGRRGETTRIELHTAGAELPTALLAACWPPLAHLGSACEFNGSLWAARESSGWSGELSGHLRQVDLDRLISDQLSYKLSGAADVTLSKVAFSRGRVQQASVDLRAQNGRIDSALLAALARELQLKHRPRSGDDVRLVNYEQLSLSAQLQAGELRLTGQCDSQRQGPKQGVMMVANREPLLAEGAPEQPRSVAALVRALVSADGTLVPAVREVEGLLPHLPLAGAREQGGRPSVKLVERSGDHSTVDSDAYKPPRTHLRVDGP